MVAPTLAKSRADDKPQERPVPPLENGDPERFWADDPAGLLATLQAGLAAPEHAAFVAALAAQ